MKFKFIVEPPSPSPPRKSHDLTANDRAQHAQVAPRVTTTPSRCTSTTLTDGKVSFPLDSRSSTCMSNQAQRLLSNARKRATSESQRTGRTVSVMDIILESFPTVATSQPCHSTANRSHLPRMQKAFTSQDLGRMELYWANRAAVGKVSRPAAYRIRPPKISAERSTILWPPNLDGESVSTFPG